MLYVVKVDGMKVRCFKNLGMAAAWATKYCHGKVEVSEMRETLMPSASDRIYPNEKNDLRYKKFVAIA